MASFGDLPRELIFILLDYLHSPDDFFAIRGTCRSLSDICSNGRETLSRTFAKIAQREYDELSSVSSETAIERLTNRLDSHPRRFGTYSLIYGLLRMKFKFSHLAVAALRLAEILLDEGYETHATPLLKLLYQNYVILYDEFPGQASEEQHGTPIRLYAVPRNCSSLQHLFTLHIRARLHEVVYSLFEEAKKLQHPDTEIMLTTGVVEIYLKTNQIDYATRFVEKCWQDIKHTSTVRTAPILGCFAKQVTLLVEFNQRAFIQLHCSEWLQVLSPRNSGVDESAYAYIHASGVAKIRKAVGHISVAVRILASACAYFASVGGRVKLDDTFLMAVVDGVLDMPEAYEHHPWAILICEKYLQLLFHVREEDKAVKQVCRLAGILRNKGHVEVARQLLCRARQKCQYPLGEVNLMLFLLKLTLNGSNHRHISQSMQQAVRRNAMNLNVPGVSLLAAEAITLELKQGHFQLALDLIEEFKLPLGMLEFYKSPFHRNSADGHYLEASRIAFNFYEAITGAYKNWVLPKTRRLWERCLEQRLMHIATSMAEILAGLYALDKKEDIAVYILDRTWTLCLQEDSPLLAAHAARAVAQFNSSQTDYTKGVLCKTYDFVKAKGNELAEQEMVLSISRFEESYGHSLGLLTLEVGMDIDRQFSPTLDSYLQMVRLNKVPSNSALVHYVVWELHTCVDDRRRRKNILFGLLLSILWRRTGNVRLSQRLFELGSHVVARNPPAESDEVRVNMSRVMARLVELALAQKWEDVIFLLAANMLTLYQYPRGPFDDKRHCELIVCLKLVCSR